VLVADTLDKVERCDDEWVQEYFQGPRGRAAQRATSNSRDRGVARAGAPTDARGP
jgi:phospholipid/cholesterol/gamma-HCH transport system ATP-binding protein